MADEKKTSGWRPLTDLEVQGEPVLAEALADVLACTGRVDRVTHGFHTWPAGMHADAAKGLVEICGGTSVLDPFCGGGAVLVEAELAGRSAVGVDLSPVAALISRARTAIWDKERISRMCAFGRKVTEHARIWADYPHDPAVRAVSRWYDPEVAQELQGLRHGINEAPREVQQALWACFSSILIKVSFRESDTSNRRIAKIRDNETTCFLFHRKVRELGRRMEDLAAAVPEGTPEAVVVEDDSLRVDLGRRFDAVITSPPYPAVYDYAPAQQLRVAWLGMDNRAALAGEIGSRRAFRVDRRAALLTWQADLRAWLKNMARHLNPEGSMAVVIGDGVSGDLMVDSLSPLIAEAQANGFYAVARASGGRVDPGIRRARREHVVLFRRRS